jgi:serine/threonine-protein kinase
MSDPEIIASRYRVLRELGRGGMGVVYVVEHIHTGDHVALKLLLDDAAKDPQLVERFKREARASARIKSEHVVKVIDADVAPELDGAPFLVMELLNGVDLDKQLEQRGRFTFDETIDYLSQAARALDKSHQMGIIHRDLKPENLFLHNREDGSTILKILDFGISKMTSGEATDLGGAGLTKTGAVMGTPFYMSPEQANGHVSQMGPCTDVWAIGLIAVQLLTGEVYWRAETIPQLMAAIIAQPFYAPSSRWPWLPPAVDAWFAKACDRVPTKRFATVGEEVGALAIALQGAAAVPPPPLSGPALVGGGASGAFATSPTISGTTTGAMARTSEPPPSHGRTRGLIAGAAVLACALGGGGAFLVRSHASEGTTVQPDAPAPSATPAAASQIPVDVSPAPAPPSTSTAEAASAAAATTASRPPGTHATARAAPQASAKSVANVQGSQPAAPIAKPSGQAAPATTRFDPTGL